MRARASTRSVALVLLSVALGLLAAGGSVPHAAAAPLVAVEPGQIVVTDQAAGEVLAVTDDGARTVLLSDLGSVRGVVVLSDGAVLVADSDAGTIVGTGGRFGDERVEVAAGLEAPEGLAVAGGGRLYVTSFSEGTLNQVDISSGQVVALAAGLDGPSAVLPLREPRSSNHLVVAEWFSGRVADLRRDGERTGALVRGLERPAGLAADGDGTVYVSDRAAGEIVAVDGDGERRVVAEVDAPTGLTLDPPEPAAGQDYELLAATGDGIQRIDVATGDATVVDELPSGAALAVAPDEFIIAGATATTIGEGGSAGAGGGDQVASGVAGRDLEPGMVALVALAVFFLGVTLISGIQLWRARGADDEDDRSAGLSRKERRRARRTDKAVQAAERKTAKEVEKAEKRAAKMAPDPEPVVAATAGAVASGPSRRERKEAQRAAKAEAKAADVNAKRQATLDAHHARQEAARAAVDEKQAKAQAKADEKRAKAQAKDDEKQAKVDAKAEAGARAESKAAPVPSPRTQADAAPAFPPSAAAAAPWRGEPAASSGLDADLSSARSSEAESATAGSRSPLFAAPPAVPLTAGPFLESLFAEDTADPTAGSGAGHDEPDRAPAPSPQRDLEPAPAPIAEPESAADAETPASPTPITAPLPASVAPPVPAVAHRSSLEPAHLADDAPHVDLSEEVAREVPPPKGVRGRRRAKRRVQTAEHRHRQLRAITSILDVPPPALPPAPVRRAIGVASAASVASPDATSGLSAPPAALGVGSLEAPGATQAAPPEGPIDPGSLDPGEPPAVPWPGEGQHGDPTAAWPNQPTN